MDIITVGTIYRAPPPPPPPPPATPPAPPSKGIFFVVPNNNMNKTDSVNNEIYILGDFNINLYLNDS